MNECKININDVINGVLEGVSNLTICWDFDALIEVIKNKKINVSFIIIHILPLEETVKAMELARKGGGA